MNIVRKLMAKPWLATEGPAEYDDVGFAMPAAKVCLRFFLAVVGVLFGLFIITLFTRAQLPDWQSLAGEPGQPLWSPTILWLNTGLLLLGSIALQYACYCARRGDRDGAFSAILVGGVMAGGFVAGQFWFWQKLMSWGYFPAGDPATSFFFLLTGVHVLHLLGGLVGWSRTLIKFWENRLPLPRLKLGIELCAVYWHFLLAVWLLLFFLLSSPPETFQAIAAMCGLR